MNQEISPVKKKSALKSFLTFIWNSKTREFLGRDGLSWAKICAFYGVFYTVLAAFFIGMLAVFVGTLDFQVPTYYGSSSTMDIAKDSNNRKNGINPGMGFRPQVDVESAFIRYSLQPDDADALAYARSLKIYLENKYSNGSQGAINNCDAFERNVKEFIPDSFQAGRFCRFDVFNLLDKSGYTAANNYGYMDDGPLILLKVNRIYKWTPSAYSPDNLPDALSSLRASLNQQNKIEFDEILRSNILVKCRGDNSADEDVFNNLIVKYFSIDEKANSLFGDKFGVVPFYYYPYLNQAGYESPAVFVKFDFKNSSRPDKFITRGVTTNVICQAFAANIDSTDKFFLRGMTQFQMFVK